jgi:glc operon protein GlcG
MFTAPVLDHEDALAMLTAAQAHALAHQWPVSIAVCDAGGHLLAFVRLKGANAASAQIAPAKARTAALLKRDTRLVEEMVNGGRTAFLSAPGLDGQLEGGVAVMVDGHCIGGVGVSGVKAPEDAQVAAAGAAALSKTAA